MKLSSYPRKKKLTALGLVFLAMLIAIFAPGEVAGLHKFHTLVKTHNHPASALAAMDTIMKLNTTRVFQAETTGYGDLPNVLVTMQPRAVEMTPSSMRIVLRSGIFPYGFKLLRTQDGWDYSWYWGWYSRVLHSVRNR